jgi:ASC-1-like (ASCH) protein
MKRITFKCKLLSDVIINSKSATVGNQQTLDFIPGNNFYGIVANKLYNSDATENELFTLLHSGSVKFGDAHPSIGDERSLHVPASMFSPKLESISNTYINQKVVDRIKSDKEFELELNKKQLKQCRKGFFIFKDNKGIPVKVDKSFSMKSAYDREKRRTADSKLFGYESIDKGLELIFNVYFENNVSDEAINKVVGCLEGTQRVGRSRTAQYGLLEISMLGSCNEEAEKSDVPAGEFYIYADSRLIIFDQYGNPTCRPTCEDLGLTDCEIDLSKTQIRTFQYSPWNFKRQAYDTDRYGLEKGSIITVTAKKETTISNFIGAYQTEGFGHIIVNPDFLEANDDCTAVYKLQEGTGSDCKNNAVTEGLVLINPNSVNGELLKVLVAKSNEEKSVQYIYMKVTEFVENNGNSFIGTDGKAFASQWGNIRNIAIQSKDLEQLERELYNNANAYLTHGKAKDKWNEYGRLDLLKKFVRSLCGDFDKSFGGKTQNEADKSIIKALKDRYIPTAVVNLASEMSKKCSNKNR